MIRILISLYVILITSIPVQAEIKIQNITSPNGIKAWLVHEPSIPIISFNILFKGGTSLDAKAKNGATYLMMGLLEEGSQSMDTVAFAKAREELSANFGFQANQDSVSITAKVLKSNAPKALALLKSALSNPNFDQSSIERVKNQVLSSLASDATNPNVLVSSALYKQAFPNHPYSRTKKGNIETVTALTRGDLLTAHANALALDRVYIGIVGDITAAELGPILDQLLGDLPKTGSKMPPKAVFSATGGNTIIDFDTPQSQALWAQSGIERNDPDFFTAYLMNHILGSSGLTSRLSKEIREKRGLTYGVYSYIASTEFGNYIGGSVASSNHKIKETINLVSQEWALMAEKGISDAELSAAKTYLTGAYPLRFDGNSQIARILAGMQMQALPISYISTRNTRINAITKQDVSRVAKYLLKANDLRFIIVGKPKGIKNLD